MKKLKIVFILLPIIFVGLQFTNPARTNPPVVHDLAATNAPAAEITALLRAACYDCHSHETKWPLCYSEAERDMAVKNLGGKPEITRFKGLGEISPKEFAQFIGKEMRLNKVEHASKPDVTNILNFYMGKNTPERKDYIMENLVVPVED